MFFNTVNENGEYMDIANVILHAVYNALSKIPELSNFKFNKPEVSFYKEEYYLIGSCSGKVLFGATINLDVRIYLYTTEIEKYLRGDNDKIVGHISLSTLEDSELHFFVYEDYEEIPKFFNSTYIYYPENGIVEIGEFHT